MKKLLFSLAIIFSLVGYSLFTRKNQTPDQAVGIAPSPPASSPGTNYKDGTYIGDVADAFYGNIQVKALIYQGKITDIRFLQYPNDRPHSVEINSQAMPILRSEAIQAQTAEVDVVTGATATSRAFVESLSSALIKAR